MRRLVKVALILLATAAEARAQSSGAIDTRAALAQRIAELEQLVGGDTAAEKQAVSLRWLADLYVEAGRLDDAESAYQRILVFFPGDPATSNDYALFLMAQRGNPERAEQILHEAVQWAQSREAPPPHMGRTHALRAQALLALGRHDDALRVSGRAIDLLDDDAAEFARRVRARCLAAMGRRDEARAEYLQLIGITGNSNADDRAELLAIESSTGVDARRFDESLDQAVANARRARAEAAVREGAAIVEISASDGARLEGTFRRGKEKAAVLFIPEAGGRRSAFTAYAQLMTLDGLTTLTVDPRGHGDSRSDSLASVKAMTAAQRARISSDVNAACAWLEKRLHVERDRIVVVAEGDAAATVERAFHERGQAAAVVYLSPVLDEADLELANARAFREPRPILAVASDEDVFAMRSLSMLGDSSPSEARSTTKTRVLSFAGHGVAVLSNPADFAAIHAWIRRTLGLEP